MSRSTFARSRDRDDKGRFKEMPRPDGDMLFCTQRGTVRPMTFNVKGARFKGLVNRLTVALSIVIRGEIPLVMVESTTFPYGNVTRFKASSLLRDTAHNEDERHGT